MSDLKEFENKQKDISEENPALASLMHVLREAESDVRNGHVAPIQDTFDGIKAELLAMQDHERTQATLALLNELEKGRKSGAEKGWLSSEAVREHFRNKAHEE